MPCDNGYTTGRGGRAGMELGTEGFAGYWEMEMVDYGMNNSGAAIYFLDLSLHAIKAVHLIPF